jgi:pimeloyl-ACP methyl ester carboxylesterase
LLMLHGLGATSEVWRGWEPLLAQRWPGRWMAPDLPGHGRSPHWPSYTFATFAHAVANLLGPADPVVVVGHSLGGVVGLVLAGEGSTVPVQAVIGLGIKVSWTEDELAKAQAMAARPVAWFASRDEAVARYLRMSGLTGLLAPDDPAVESGIRHENGQWRLAMDTGTFAVGAPDLPTLLSTSRATVVLARGAGDPMNTDEQLAALVPAARIRTIPGVGHNAHVEDPPSAFDHLDPASLLTR